MAALAFGLLVLLAGLSPMDANTSADIEARQAGFASNSFSATSSPIIPAAPVLYPSTAKPRRLSAARGATVLKDKSLIPARPGKCRKPSLAQPVPGPADLTPAACDSPSTAKAAEIDTTQRGPVTRSGRKRKLTGGDTADKKSKMAGNKSQTSGLDDDPVLQRMAAMFKEVRGDIARSEESTVNQIDKKIECLSSKLTTRLDRAENDLSNLGSQVADARSEMEIMRGRTESSVAAMQRRIDSIQKQLVSGPPAGRPSAGPRLTGANAAPMGKCDRNEERYWTARRSLRIWPCRGPDYDKSVREFLGIMLKMAADRISSMEFDVAPLPSLRERVDQVVVTFATIAQRDEV